MDPITVLACVWTGDSHDRSSWNHRLDDLRQGIFGDLASLNHLPSGWALFPFISGIITAIVQNFLSWRIYKLTNSIWLPAVIFVLSMVGCAFSFLFGIRVIKLGLHYSSPQAVGEYLDVWISCAAVCDVLGTGAIVTILAKSYSKSLFRSTRTMVSNLLKFTVETGLVTTVWAIIHVSLWATMPQTSFHYIFYFSLPRLYSNWLFATLNSRLYLASSGQADSRAQSSLWSDLPAPRTQDGHATIHRFGAQVHVTTTTEIVMEDLDLSHIAPNKYNHTILDSSSV
ncbi:hypothetical protein PTI98_013218 [Pleurotus ostreatus]|nr:hypothetical protein PTI98_013218 [Pleurotus ostreatus]